MGHFVVLESIDRGGKTTNTASVIRALRSAGRRVATTAYPDREAPVTGPLIRRFLTPRDEGGLRLTTDDDSRAVTRMLMGQLMFALNRREKAPTLEALLADHDLVLCSRYQLSGRIYAMAGGIGAADHLTATDMDRLFDVEADLRRPELTIVIDLDADAAALRSRDDLDAFDRDIELQRRVRDGYLNAAMADPRIVVVSGVGGPEDVGGRILRAIAGAFPDLGI